jgi:hypothetical protein
MSARLELRLTVSKAMSLSMHASVLGSGTGERGIRWLLLSRDTLADAAD